jgi:hypothetical protein
MYCAKKSAESQRFPLISSRRRMGHRWHAPGHGKSGELRARERRAEGGERRARAPSNLSASFWLSALRSQLSAFLWAPESDFSTFASCSTLPHLASTRAVPLVTFRLSALDSRLSAPSGSPLSTLRSPLFLALRSFLSALRPPRSLSRALHTRQTVSSEVAQLLVPPRFPPLALDSPLSALRFSLALHSPPSALRFLWLSTLRPQLSAFSGSPLSALSSPLFSDTNGQES